MQALGRSRNRSRNRSRFLFDNTGHRDFQGYFSAMPHALCPRKIGRDQSAQVGRRSRATPLSRRILENDPLTHTLQKLLSLFVARMLVMGTAKILFTLVVPFVSSIVYVLFIGHQRRTRIYRLRKHGVVWSRSMYEQTLTLTQSSQCRPAGVGGSAI